MSEMSVPGHAVQILNIVGDSTHPTREGRLLKLNTQVLRDITGKVDKEGHPLAVIAIAGPERQGKSFILTYFVRYLQALERAANDSHGDWMERDQPDIPTKELGFRFQNSFERTTEGIWMWSRPFIIPRPNNPEKKIAVLLMDTEGCYGSSLSNQEQAAFVGLSLLTSSVFIYNETSRVNDNTLATVGKFMQYGQLALNTFQAKMFQRMMFLVRDWSSPSLFEYGAAGGQGFIQKLFEETPKMSKEAVEYRKAIMTNFEDCNAYLMPHPGKRVISDQFKGSVAEMEPEFHEHVQGFVENLMADIAPKNLSGQAMSGSAYASLFVEYVNAFNSSEMPSPASIVKTALFIAFDTEIRRLTETFEKGLRARLGEVEGFVPNEQLMKMKKKVEANIFRLFEEKKLTCSPEDKALYSQKLKSEVDQAYARINEENEGNRGRFLEDAGNGIIAKFGCYLSESVQPSVRYWKQAEFDSTITPEQERLIQNFREACSLVPAQYVEVNAAIVTEKMNKMKETLWSDLAQKTKFAEQTAKAILQEIVAEFVSTVAELIGDDMETDTRLNRLLQKQSKFATNNFRRRMESEFKDPTFVTEFINQLEAFLTAESQRTRAINSSKWDEIKVEFDTEIDETMKGFTEEVEIMFQDISTADDAALTGIYEKIKKIGIEALEEIDCPSNDLQKHCIRQLKDKLQNAYDGARNRLANSIEAKIRRCQEIAESSSQKFEHELREWMEATGTVTSAVFDSESCRVMHNELTRCQNSMNSVYAEHESHFNDAKQMMEDRRIELAAVNQQKVEEVTRSVMRQLQGFRRSYGSEFEDLVSEIKRTSDLQRIHMDISARLLRTLRQDLQEVKAESLFSTFELSATKEMNDIFDCKRKEFEAKAAALKHLQCHVIPNHEAEFRAEMEETIKRNPFISEEDFQQILKGRCPEVIKHVSRQISQVVPLESVDGAAMNREAQLRIELIKEQLIGDLRDIHEEAEKAVKSVDQRILGFATKEINHFVESLIIQGTTAVVGDEFQDIRSTVESKFESEWPYDAISKKDEIKLQLLQKVDDEIDEAQRKFRAKAHEEAQIVAAVMNSTLSSYAEGIAEVLENGKYIPMQKLQQQLNDGLSESQKSFDSALKNRNLSHSKYTDELTEKLSQKRHSLLQKNKESLEKLLEKIDGFISEKYTCSVSIRSPAELAELKRKIEEEVVQLLDDKCEGVCDNELRDHVRQKVEDYHSTTVEKKEAEVNSSANFHVENAVRYYSESMTEGLGPILPQHPTILRSWHDRSKVQALQKLKRAGVFITDLLENQIDQALEQAYKAWEDKNNLTGGEDKNLAIGIDLGTTTCCVAIHRLRETQVIKDRSGRNLTPSFLFITNDGSPMVGQEAKDQAHIHPEDTVFDAKRLIGRKFNNPYVQKDMKTWPFKVVNDTATGEPRIIIKGKPYRPEEVLAQQLRHMKLIAEEELQEPGNIKKAVITVPANFNDRQRDATRQAAQIAGLDVLQIINEPTAAAMAYAVQWKGIKKTVLVFDFGGGTLDVTILQTGEDEKPSANVADPLPSESRGLQEASKNEELEAETESSNVRLHVLTTLGDTHLGGEDFDSNLVNFCVKKFEETEGVKLLEADQSRADFSVKRRLRRLRNVCEQVKACLTYSESATANLDNIYEDLHLQVIVTKKEFEEMNEELFQKAISVVADALASAKLQREDIDEVLMVGGSSRIPRMRELLQKFLGKENLHLNQRVDIQEAIAKGAALQACILNGVSSVEGLPKVTDVQPFSLGIREYTDEMSVIIPRNTKIPAKATKRYVTAFANQAVVDITIYSGENEVADSPENVCIGEFILEGIPRGRKGKQTIDVTMEIDASGILNVTAVCLSTGGKKSLVIKSDRGRLSDEQIVEARARFA